MWRKKKSVCVNLRKYNFYYCGLTYCKLSTIRSIFGWMESRAEQLKIFIPFKVPHMGNWVLFENLCLCTFRTFQECEILPKHSLWQFIKKTALHICRIHSHSETRFLTLNFLLGLSSIFNFGRKSNVNSPFFLIIRKAVWPSFSWFNLKTALVSGPKCHKKYCFTLARDDKTKMEIPASIIRFWKIVDRSHVTSSHQRFLNLKNWKKLTRKISLEEWIILWKVQHACLGLSMIYANVWRIFFCSNPTGSYDPSNFSHSTAKIRFFHKLLNSVFAKKKMSGCCIRWLFYLVQRASSEADLPGIDMGWRCLCADHSWCASWTSTTLPHVS